MRTVGILATVGGLIALSFGCGQPEGVRSPTSGTAAIASEGQTGGALGKVQAIVRSKCDAKAVVTAVRDQGSYDEAVWGEAQVRLPTGGFQTAPAYWARLAKAQPSVQSTSCGQFEY